jgi:hypothetical protein
MPINDKPLHRFIVKWNLLILRHYIGFEVLTAVGMKMAVFWVVAPCSLVVYQRFRGTCCLHHQGARTQNTAIFLRHYVLCTLKVSLKQPSGLCQFHLLTCHNLYSIETVASFRVCTEFSYEELKFISHADFLIHSLKLSRQLAHPLSSINILSDLWSPCGMLIVVWSVRVFNMQYI